MAITHFSGPVNSLAGFTTNGLPWTFGGAAFKTGRWYGPVSTALEGTATPPANTFICAGLYVGRAAQFDRIGINVTTAGLDAGNKSRLGIYYDDGHGAPGALLLDAGQVGSGSGDGTGGKSITIALTLLPGWYWIGGVSQAVSTTGPVLASTNGVALPSLGLASPSGLIPTGWSMAGVSGALPDALTPALYTAAMPLVLLRAL